MRSQLNKSHLEQKTRLDLTATSNLSQLISHASTHRNYQKRYETQGELSKFSSNRQIKSSNEQKNKHAVLRTAGDEDDVQVEEYEDYDLQVKANNNQ